VSIAVFSDIHGNLEALNSVLGELASRGIRRMMLGGDLVGYGADPVACIERVMEHQPMMVAGNHDWAAIGRIDTGSFNEAAAAAASWTASQLGESHRSLLAALPLEHREDDILLVHASPMSPSEWSYLAEVDDVRHAVEASDRLLCMVGHSHVPFIYGRGDGQEMFDRRPGRHTLKPGWRYLVNVGSVGQPRDGDPRASFAVVDLGSRSVDLVRIRYAVATAQAKIRAVDALPDFLAWRLHWGF
jgi:diadenosine tetraphosphatase ApaH/serine/threonine PP2A family protein phosphatase